MIRLLRFLKPYTVPVYAVVVLVFFQSMANLYLPTLMSDIVNNGITNGDISYIMRMGGRMLLVALGGSASAITAAYLASHASMGFGEILRRRIFTHVLGFSLHEFDTLGTPSLVTRNTNDVTQVQMVLLIMMRMIISAPIMAIGGIIMAISKDRGLAWVIAVVVPILAATITIVAAKGFPLFRAIQRKIDRVNLVLRERLTGIRVIRAFNRIGDEKVRFQDANLDLTRTLVQVNRLMAVVMPILMLVMNLTTVAIIWFGSIRIDRGTTNVGDMMAFLQYAMQILFALLMAALLLIMVPRAQASAERINEVLATRPGMQDPERPRGTAEGARGRVEFRSVTFSYPGAERPALCDVSFSAAPGEVTAIIGSTGSGKSSLIHLIPRFYDVDAGSILIDGVDIREMSQESLRARIGLVPQRAVLFSGTIAENIRFGREEATDEEVHRAAEIAQAVEFITQMKDGFEAIVSQGGTNISGGQKQRLSIARAIVRRPEVYLFDDCFSALDFRTDARLRAALKKETLDSTVVIVGQRVATIMDADRIIVLEEGRVAGMGTHRELYASCEVYQEIVASQLSEEEIA